MRIHATAVIDSRAEIADDVRVGPYSIVGPDVKIGAGTQLQSHVVIEGAVEIGAGNIIGHGAVIGGQPQDLGFDPQSNSSVRIGDGNTIREYCTIHRGSKPGGVTQIGDRNFLMCGVHVGHDCTIANDVIIANNCLLAGHVQIHERAFIGGATTFHQGMRVGRLVMAQGSSGFGKDIPPFLLGAERNAVFGVNVIGLKRAGFTTEERAEVKRAFKLLYLSGLNTRQALEAAEKAGFGPIGTEFFAFVAAAKKRGIVPYHRGTKSADAAD